MLRVAGEKSVRSIAMSAIGIGGFKFPIELAAKITGLALAKGSTLAPCLESVRVALSPDRPRWNPRWYWLARAINGARLDHMEGLMGSAAPNQDPAARSF